MSTLRVLVAGLALLFFCAAAHAAGGVLDPYGVPQAGGVLDPYGMPQAGGVLDPYGAPQAGGVLDPYGIID